MKTPAIIGVSALLIGISATPSLAICDEWHASRELDTLIAGGYDLIKALKVVEKGSWFEPTELCWTKVRGYTRKNKSILPYLYNALQGR